MVIVFFLQYCHVPVTNRSILGNWTSDLQIMCGVWVCVLGCLLAWLYAYFSDCLCACIWLCIVSLWSGMCQISFSAAKKKDNQPLPSKCSLKVLVLPIPSWSILSSVTFRYINIGLCGRCECEWGIKWFILATTSLALQEGVCVCLHAFVCNWACLLYQIPWLSLALSTLDFTCHSSHFCGNIYVWETF